MIDTPLPSGRGRGEASSVPASGVRLACAALTAIMLATAVPAAAQRPRPGLTAVSGLAVAYTAILDARFDEVPRLLSEACGPAPKEACQLLDALNLWWQIQSDPPNRSRDRAFETRVNASIAAVEAWVTREPERAEAWFYLGGAYGARAQWRVLRGSRLAAARDGKRIKDALERALAIDPTMSDAHFGIGLYHYYADVAPAAMRIFRWLLLLPGGDRVRGLEEINRARANGLLVRGEADYQLHLLYLWYERQPDRALTLVTDLIARHPRNPHFRQSAAEIHDIYLHDASASLRVWEALLEAARTGHVSEPQMAQTAARLGIALQLDRLARSEEAIEPLRRVIATRPTAPFAAVPRAHLLLGDVFNHLGRRAEATHAYRTAITEAGDDDPLRIAARARAALRAQP